MGFDYISRAVRGIRRRLDKKGRIREWTKALKDDADFDYSYILSVLRYKLERTRTHIKEHGIIASADKVASEIKEVEDLIQKVIDDNYFDELSSDFREKNGELEMDVGPGGFLRFRFSKRTHQESDMLNEEWHAFEDKAHEARVADLRKAFDLMATNIWGWWD